MTDPTAKLSRRGFLAGAAATAAALGIASRVALPAHPALADSADEPVTGGTFKFYLNNPTAIDPYNVQEDQGMQVAKCLFDALTEYDYGEGAIVGKAAESWEANDDATQFTFHLREGMTFHNGDPVTSESFAYGWNRLCSPNSDPDDPSVVSYHLSVVDGYDAVQAGEEGAELNLECPDDLTLVVNLNAPYADFPYIVSHLATSPIPESAAEGQMDTYKLAPVGNGAFKMAEGTKWEDGQYIQLVRNDDYWGDVAYIDGVTFSIQKDVDTAFMEFEAGNLDYAQIPSGRISSCIAAYGESSDGYTANPGEQTLLGSEPSIYYLTCNNTDEVMGNVHMRKAISYAINRQTICDVVFEGTRVPADNFITPGINGYEEGVWEACTQDLDKAAEELATAKEELGLGDDITITLSCNSDGGHEAIMELIQADLANIGITAEIETAEWAAYLTQLQEKNYQIGRLGWIADYPIMDNFLYPMFYTDNGDNRSGYSNPDVDAALDEARQIVDDEERVAAFQEINKTISEDFPVIPVMFYRHTIVTSARVHNMYANPMKLIDFTTCWLTD